MNIACRTAIFMLFAFAFSLPASAAEPMSEKELKELRKQIFWGLDVSFSGYARVEGTSEKNFDLGSQSAADETFYDFRAYLDSRIARGAAALNISLDIAGDDFSDPEGAVFGNAKDFTSTPGGPAVMRENNWNVRTRHLFLSYDGFVKASAGRMPAKIGHGIVVNTIRDSAKLGKSFGPWSVMGVLVKGGETQPNANYNASKDNDLDAAALLIGYKNPQVKAQLALAKQWDSTFDQTFPQKAYVDFSVDGVQGPFSYQLETAYYGGSLPKRVKNRGWFFYGRGDYRWGRSGDSVSFRMGAGSGDNNATDGVNRDFQSLFMNARGFQIANIFGNDIHSYDAFLPGVNGDGNNAGAGFANTGFIQVAVSAVPFSEYSGLSMETVLTYLRATRSQFVGDGILISAADGFTASAGETQRTRNIGWEVDLNLRNQLSKAMGAYFRFGYFSPGDIFGVVRSNAIKMQGGFDYAF